MQDLQQRYDAEYRDKAITRAENDAALLPKLGDIRSGLAADVLARFAKAYLGMFLEMDNAIAPEARLSVLTNPQLAEAIRTGFLASLYAAEPPTPTVIADSLIQEQPLDSGYVLLAGIHHRFDADDPSALLTLPHACLLAAVCFHYANQTSVSDRWLEVVMRQRPELVAEALQAFWLRLIVHHLDYLPGLDDIINHDSTESITRQVILPVLAHWQDCRKRVLRDVLHAALRVAERESLREVVAAALPQWNPYEPGRYALWLGSAFLLTPDQYAEQMADYLGRSRERILPLLDFVVMVLMSDTANRYALSSQDLAQLLRLIAPKFTPQYDQKGSLCDNTQKVMYLFYRLACATDSEAVAVSQQLGAVRVMKLYAAILERVISLQQANEKLEFEVFVQRLQQEKRIKAKLNWSDLH